MSNSTGRTWTLPAAFGLGALLLFLLPGLLGSYGIFIDEFYYLSCSKRLAWGYVDHPPLAPFLLRLSRALLGDGLLALRLPVALIGALSIAGMVRLSRGLGAGTFGQTLVGAAALTAPGFQVIFGFYSMNTFEVVFWLACTWLLIEIERRREPRLWLAFGLVAGLGLMNKHTLVLLAAGLAVGLISTPARRHLARPWLWLGLGLAALMILPNLLWQVANGWPSLEFYRNADLYKNVPTPPLEVLAQQVLFMSPGTLPVWLAGLVFLLRRRGDGADLRHVGMLALALLFMMVLGQKSRPDRIFGIYPVLLAAGGVMLERLTLRSARPVWLRTGVVAWLLVWGTLVAPVGLPILAPPVLARYAAWLGVVPQIERGEGKRAALPQWFADRLGWEQLVEDVAAARDKLTPEEREQAVYFTPSYGQAGALEWLGRNAGLERVHSSHNTWYLWGPPTGPIDIAVVLGNDRERLGGLFEQVELAGIHDCDYCMPWRDQMPIWIVRRERGSIAARWPEWKHYE